MGLRMGFQPRKPLNPLNLVPHRPHRITLAMKACGVIPHHRGAAGGCIKPDMQTQDARPAASIAVLRGARHRCPACGEGRLYAGYLKQVSACPVCAAPLDRIRAEDGPPWLTVLLLGPLLAGLTFISARQESWPIWIKLPALGVFAIGAVLVLLPRIKGAIIGLFWSMGAADSDDGSPD